MECLVTIMVRSEAPIAMPQGCHGEEESGSQAPNTLWKLKMGDTTGLRPRTYKEACQSQVSITGFVNHKVCQSQVLSITGLANQVLSIMIPNKGA